MKRTTGSLGACIVQAVHLDETSLPTERERVPLYCQLQGKLLAGLSLVPGEASGMPIQRLGEAVSIQASISPFPLEHATATLWYDESGYGTLVEGRRVVGTLSLQGEQEPSVLLYRPDPLEAPVQMH